MPITKLEDLFQDTLRDIYWAEKQLLKVLPKMAKKADSTELAEALQNHRAETEGQIERLEKVFEMLGQSARGKTCEAMVGLTAEGDHVVEETEAGPVRDTGIIGAAQAVEHYEMARYISLVAMAEQLGMDDAAALLSETLEEEQHADQLLGDLCTTILEDAEESREAAE